VNASLQAFVKSLPVYPVLDTCRDWYTLRKGNRRRTYSQHGEDRFVLDYFGDRPGFYIDVGANHPFRISNTYLLYLNDWRGITIEPLPALSRKHLYYRPRDTHFNVGAGSQDGVMRLYDLIPAVLTTFDEEIALRHITDGRAVLVAQREIPVRTLSSLCREAEVPARIDFLSIDCEGNDIRVLEGLDWSQKKPILICIETAGVAKAQESKPGSGRDIKQFLEVLGYRILQQCGVNTFFELDSRHT